MSKFERFLYKKLQTFGEPTATITKAGIINLNITTMEEHVKDNLYAILFHNKEDSQIGIQFTKEKFPEAYRIIKYRNDKFGTVSAMAFLKYYKIPHKTTQVYYVEWNAQENMIIINLKQHEKKRGESKQLLG